MNALDWEVWLQRFLGACCSWEHRTFTPDELRERLLPEWEAGLRREHELGGEVNLTAWSMYEVVEELMQRTAHEHLEELLCAAEDLG